MSNQEDTKQKNPNVPNLRFGHGGKTCLLGDVVTLPKSTISCTKRFYVSTENLVQGFQGLVPYLDNTTVKGVSFQGGDTLLANIRPYLKKALLASFDGCCSADVICFRPKELLPEYLYYIIANDRFVTHVMEACKGSKMPRGDKNWMLQKQIFVPTASEQRKTANLLSLLDQRITTQNKIIEGLQRQKKTLRDHIFSTIRGMEKPLSEIVSYEQPSRYIVKSDCYSADSSLTPVLTANKAFILGYTTEKEGIYEKGDAVIFDDFTLDMKYVHFPFKVKSSAIKILSCKNKTILRYVYEYLCYLNLHSSEHKRHWISEIAALKISMNEMEKMETIACLFEIIDRQITLEQQALSLYKAQKDFFLKNMFI